MRFASFLCCCLFLLVSLVGAEPTTIQFWHAFSGPREARLAAMVERFQQENPEIVVELRGFTDKRGAGNDYAELYRNLLQALGEGKPPVVSLMYENWVAQLADVRVLVPLEHHLEAAYRDMPKVFLQASTHRDGHRYSMPFNKSLWALFANADLLEGREAPQNWSELRIACNAFHKQFPSGTLAVPAPVELFTMHFLSQGGHFFNEHLEPSFAGPLGLSSGGYLLGLASQDHSAIFGKAAYQKFLQGELPYLIDTSAKLSQLEETLGDRLRVFPLPRGAGDRIQLTGTQLSLFAASSPRQQRAAVRLLRYLSSPEQTRSWAIETGYLPVRTSALEDPIYTEYLKARPGRAVIAGSLSRAQVQPQVVGWEATRILINDALERILYQKRPVDRELLKAQQTSTKLIRGLQGKH